MFRKRRVDPNPLQTNTVRLEKGDLLAWKNDGSFVGNMVSYLTGGDYTHVGIVWTLHGRAYVIDAYWRGGVRLRSLPDNLPVDHISTKIRWTDTLEDFALSKLGREYHYVGAAMLGFDINPSYDAHVCSTYAANILIRGGMDIPKVSLSPQSLVEVVSKLRNEKIHTIKEMKGLDYEISEDLETGPESSSS